jgi:N-formylmaleamate deformylase
MPKFPAGAHVHANGIRQHYLRFGARGPRVVIVPGIVSPAILWAHVGEWLGVCCECFVLDVRGRGLSEAGSHLDYTFESCAQDLLAFVRQMDLGPVIVLGHSMGARIAARAVARDEGLFRALVLLDPPTSGPGRRPYPIPLERTLALLRAACRAEPANTSPTSAPWPQDLQRLREEWLPTCDERAVDVAYEQFHSQDLFADLALLRLPLALVCAGQGGVVSDEDVEEIRRVHAKLQTLRVAGVGHQMQAENFGLFSRALAHVLRHQDPAFERLSP